jgi:O-antigen ligase
LKQIFERSPVITLIALVLIVMIMPLHHRFLPPAIILMAAGWLLEKRFSILSSGGFIPGYRILFLLFFSFFLWQVLTLLYSNDRQEGLSNIFTRLSLLVFPLVMFDANALVRDKRKTLLGIFALSTALYMTVCFIYAFERSLFFTDGKLIFDPVTPEAKWLNYFYGSDLVFSIHPTYMALFVITAAFISLEWGRDKSRAMIHRAGWLLTGLFLLVSVYFISSRAGILAAVIMVVFYMTVLLLAARKHKLLRFVVIVLIILTVLPLVRHNSRLSFFVNSLSAGGYEVISRDNRFIVWRHAAKLSMEQPLAGFGIGDARDQLAEQYLLSGEQMLYNDRYNAHNQFLESFLEGGVIQLLLLVSVTGFMMVLAIRERNLLYTLFIIMILVFFMVESILYRLAGVSFFSLFSFLLLKYDPNNFSHSQL